jgi:phosphatidylglycerophosphate synthase
MAQPVQWSDLKNLPTAITLLRGLFAATIPFWPFKLLLPLYLLALLSDVVDGTLARKTGQVTRSGAMLDGWVDKILHVNLLWYLAILDRFPDWYLLAFWSREIIQAPLVPILTRRFRLGLGPDPSTNLSGRIAAILLAVATIGILLGYPSLLFTLAIGFFGVLSGLLYLHAYILKQVRLW